PVLVSMQFIATRNGHTFAVTAGLRLDTIPGDSSRYRCAPHWQTNTRKPHYGGALGILRVLHISAERTNFLHIVAREDDSPAHSIVAPVSKFLSCSRFLYRP